MRHDLRATGTAFGLRPVRTDDAAFVLGLRTDPELGRHLHATSPRVEDQVAWIERYLERDGDWYFVVEHLATGTPHGTISVYDHDPGAGTAEWGRWVLRRGSFAALESAALLYDLAFGPLGLSLLHCRTRAANESVVSFHTSTGALLHGRVVDADGEVSVEQRMTPQRWAQVRPSLEPQIAAAASLSDRRALVGS